MSEKLKHVGCLLKEIFGFLKSVRLLLLKAPHLASIIIRDNVFKNGPSKIF